MTAWKNMTADDRDRIFLAAAFLVAPGGIGINPRSKNDCEQAASMVERGLLSDRLSITKKGRAALRFPTEGGAS